jgi:hypothetical protein
MLRYRGVLLLASSGLIIWFFYFVLVYLVAELGCFLRQTGVLAVSARGFNLFFMGATAFTVLLIGITGWLGYRHFRRERAERGQAYDSAVGEFAAPLTLAVAVTAIISTILTGLPAFMVTACQ